MSRAEAHLGVSPAAPSQDEPTLTLEQVGRFSCFVLIVKMRDLVHFVDVFKLNHDGTWVNPHISDGCCKDHITCDSLTGFKIAIDIEMFYDDIRKSLFQHYWCIFMASLLLVT